VCLRAGNSCGYVLEYMCLCAGFHVCLSAGIHVFKCWNSCVYVLELMYVFYWNWCEFSARIDVWFCWDFIEGYVLKFMVLMWVLLRFCWGICGENRCVIVLRILCMLRLKVVEISMVTNVKLKIQIYWCLDIDVAGGAVGIEPSSRQEQPRSRTGRWISPLFLYDM
jgi:hypothetical protein